MGDPARSRDRERITKAAELGGATQVIEKLPKKFDTFLTPPVMDHYSMLPKQTKSLFGVKNLSNLDTSFGYSSETHSLSGGEYQRLALCVYFPNVNVLFD
jgi:ABC-type multidrug transport system fused ATPase/permease subunit